jgi:hypothetical protein
MDLVTICDRIDLASEYEIISCDLELASNPADAGLHH